MSERGFSFSIQARAGAARTGVLSLPRGDIRTPAFMPVGTAATVKGIWPEHVEQAGADILLGNTYHLMLRPTAERVASLGGLHKFMNWNKPILTDSGGFQVMSLSSLRKMSEQGVKFRSHIDGSEHFLSPERSIEIQNLLGADIVMQLDECIALPAPDKAIRAAMELSLRWAHRSSEAFGTPHGRMLFGIVQGGTNETLRRESAEGLVKMGFDGYALGGLAVGEGQEDMLRTIEATVPFLPDEKPHYLMGVGTPLDLIQAVARGIDMFDCVMPTREGRHGVAYTHEGKLNMKNARFADDNSPLNEHSTHPMARAYSKAYVHHLIKAGEILGFMILSLNNIAFYQQWMSDIRGAIENGTFEQLLDERKNYGQKNV